MGDSDRQIKFYLINKLSWIKCKCPTTLQALIAIAVTVAANSFAFAFTFSIIYVFSYMLYVKCGISQRHRHHQCRRNAVTYYVLYALDGRSSLNNANRLLHHRFHLRNEKRSARAWKKSELKVNVNEIISSIRLFFYYYLKYKHTTAH